MFIRTLYYIGAMPHRNVSIVIFYTGDGKLLLQDRKGIAKFGEDYDFFGGGIKARGRQF